jgi:hypothetical protein
MFFLQLEISWPRSHFLHFSSPDQSGRHREFKKLVLQRFKLRRYRSNF